MLLCGTRLRRYYYYYFLSFFFPLLRSSDGELAPACLLGLNRLPCVHKSTIFYEQLRGYGCGRASCMCNVVLEVDLLLSAALCLVFIRSAVIWGHLALFFFLFLRLDSSLCFFCFAFFLVWERAEKFSNTDQCFGNQQANLQFMASAHLIWFYWHSETLNYLKLI